MLYFGRKVRETQVWFNRKMNQTYFSEPVFSWFKEEIEHLLI